MSGSSGYFDSFRELVIACSVNSYVRLWRRGKFVLSSWLTLF